MIGVVALLSVPLAGYCILGALRGPARRKLFLLAELPLLFGLGAGVLYSFFLLGGWLGPVSLLSLHLFLAALGVLWLFRRIRNRPPDGRDDTTPGIGKGELLLLGGLLGLFLAFVVLTLLLPIFDWEARILWALKAKILTAEPTLSGEVFRDPYRLHIHPRYPLMVPFLSSWMARHQGAFLEWHYQLLIDSFALLTLWQLFLLLLRLTSRTITLILTSVMALTGVWISAQFGSRVETALAFFLLLAVDRLIRWMEAKQAIDLALAGIFLYCGAMTKNEGMLLALCTFLAFFPVALKESGTRAALRAAGLLAGVFVILSAAWFARLVEIPSVSDERYLDRLGYDVFTSGIARLPQIARAVLARVTDLSRWHLLWLTPLAAAVTLFRGKCAPDRRLEMVAILASLYFAGLLTIYVISPWRDIVLHVEATFDRAALPLLPLFILMIALACKDGGRPLGEDRHA